MYHCDEKYLAEISSVRGLTHGSWAGATELCPGFRERDWFPLQELLRATRPPISLLARKY